MAFKKQQFTIKTYGAQLYKWSPTPSDKKIIAKSQKPFYCNATPNSQGQDWISTYSYNIFVTPNGQQERLAYVECGYVE
jgi:hypothetical protein